MQKTSCGCPEPSSGPLSSGAAWAWKTGWGAKRHSSPRSSLGCPYTDFPGDVNLIGNHMNHGSHEARFVKTELQPKWLFYPCVSWKDAESQTVPYTRSLPIFAQVCFSENLYHVNGFKIFGLELPNCCLMAKKRSSYQLWEIDTMRMVFNVLNLKRLSNV